MFKLGQTLTLNLPGVDGTVEAKVCATGGGYTTIAPQRRMCEGYAYTVSSRLRCFTDEELEGMKA